VRVLEYRHVQAAAIFDLEDRYARERGVLGPHPRIDGPMSLLAVARMTAAGRVELTPPATLEIRRNDSGFDLFFGLVRRPDGALRTLDDGTYVVRVETEGRYQRAENGAVVIPEPSVPYRFDLEPGYAYAFPSGSPARRSLGPTLLRGVLQAPDGSGIAGAVVEVVAVAGPYDTDESGQWVLVFPDSQASGDVTVSVTLPNGAVTQVPNVPVVAGRETVLGQTALRGGLLTNDGRPIAGAAVTIAGRAGITSTRPDGSWLFVLGLGVPPAVVDVTATLPDGRSQTAPAIPIQPRATVVVPIFRFA
jgi:hypothetical protein